MEGLSAPNVAVPDKSFPMEKLIVFCSKLFYLLSVAMTLGLFTDESIGDNPMLAYK